MELSSWSQVVTHQLSSEEIWLRPLGGVELWSNRKEIREAGKDSEYEQKYDPCAAAAVDLRPSRGRLDECVNEAPPPKHRERYSNQEKHGYSPCGRSSKHLSPMV